MGKINVNSYINDSIVDGPGVRFTLFVQGCPHACTGCHNKSSWSFDENKMMDIQQIIDLIEKDTIGKKVTISGGEPLSQVNEVYELCKKLKEKNYHIYLYTGYTIDEVKNSKNKSKILNVIDVIVDGKFIQEELDYSNEFRGSENQKIIDLKK